MIHPQLAAAQRSRAPHVPLHDDVLAVRRPDGGGGQRVFLLGQLPTIRAVAIHQPDVVDAAAIADESDRPAVGAVARLVLVRDAAGEQLGVTALDRDAVDVAQHIKNDPAAVRAHVQAHPSPLVRLELDGLRRPVLGLDVPLGLRGLLGGEIRREQQEASGQAKGEAVTDRAHAGAPPVMLDMKLAWASALALSRRKLAVWRGRGYPLVAG